MMAALFSLPLAFIGGYKSSKSIMGLNLKSFSLFWPKGLYKIIPLAVVCQPFFLHKQNEISQCKYQLRLLIFK